MHYYAARYYDDHLGQFISPDTLVPDATSVLDYNRFMYTRGNPLNRTDPTGHNDAIFDQYGGGGGKEALLIKAAIVLVAITIATQRATHGPPPLVAPRVPSWDEFWPQQQEEQPSVTGFPTITAEDDGLLTTPSSHAPGMNLLSEPRVQQQEVGGNILLSSAFEKIIQGLPGNPADLGDEWIDVTDSRMRTNTQNREFIHSGTGLKIRFDKGEKGLFGFRGKDHYHVYNPNSTGKKDLYLDINGNPVPRNSRASHIEP